MTVPVRVSEHDLLGLLSIVSDHRADDPGDGLPLSLFEHLMQQVPCDEISFFGLDSQQQAMWFGQGIPVTGDGDMDAFWTHFWDSLPCSYPERSGDLRSVTRASDFYSARQWHATGMYCDYFHPAGIEHELMMCLPVGPGSPGGPGRSVRLIFFRGAGPDFSERDRGLLTLLRPHLDEAYRTAEQLRLGTPRLTPRQRELLHLVADGYTNAQVGRRLGVSEGTVRKHLENIYAKLQVSSRTAAVTRAFPDRVAI